MTDASTDGFAEAVDAARRADAAILVLGGRSGLVDGCTSGESIDRAELGLPGVQEALVRAVAATGTPLVVVVIDGRPLALTSIAELAPALVLAWLPGEEGGAAVADVLFGAISPSGRLPVSLPRAVGQLPVFYNHKPSGGRSQWRGAYVDLPTQPLFAVRPRALVHVASSTRPRARADALPASGVLEVSIDVSNTGARPADEVVQLYLHDRRRELDASGEAARRLRARDARAGRDSTRRLPRGSRAARLPRPAHAARRRAGAIKVMLGASSEDMRARGTLRDHGARGACCAATRSGRPQVSVR